MFERFTTDARLVVVGAEEQARALQHSYIGTEHLLLAMLSKESGATELLTFAGLRAEQVRADIVRIVGTAGLADADIDALKAIGIDIDAVRAKVEESFGPGALDPPTPAKRRWFQPGGRIPFTKRSKKVLELALRESLRLKHKDISAKHLLLGLIREGEGLACKVMADAGVDLELLRVRTLESLHQTV